MKAGTVIVCIVALIVAPLIIITTFAGSTGLTMTEGVIGWGDQILSGVGWAASGVANFVTGTEIKDMRAVAEARGYQIEPKPSWTENVFCWPSDWGKASSEYEAGLRKTAEELKLKDLRTKQQFTLIILGAVILGIFIITFMIMKMKRPVTASTTIGAQAPNGDVTIANSKKQLSTNSDNTTVVDFTAKKASGEGTGREHAEAISTDIYTSDKD